MAAAATSTTPESFMVATRGCEIWKSWTTAAERGGRTCVWRIN